MSLQIINRGRPKNPEPLRDGQNIIKWKDCPDCAGRGWYLINPFATGGNNGCGGIGNACQCQTCIQAKAYWDEHGVLPPEFVEAPKDASQ